MKKMKTATPATSVVELDAESIALVSGAGPYGYYWYKKPRRETNNEANALAIGGVQNANGSPNALGNPTGRFTSAHANSVSTVSAVG